MLQDGWEYFTWLRHQVLRWKNIFTSVVLLYNRVGKRLEAVTGFFYRGYCSTVYWAFGIIQSIFWKMKGTWVTASILIEVMFYLLQNYHFSYDLRSAVGHPYGSQFPWEHHDVASHFMVPPRQALVPLCNISSLLQWRALVEHHCRQSSFRIVSHFQLHVPFHQFKQCWFPYLKYLPLWDLRASWEAN